MRKTASYLAFTVIQRPDLNCYGLSPTVIKKNNQPLMVWHAPQEPLRNSVSREEVSGSISVRLNGFKLSNLFLRVVAVLASSGFKFLDLGLCLGFRLCYISSVPTAKHVLHFFFSTWRDQTPTHRMAEVSQSLGVCRASSCSFSSSCLPQYWTTWVGVTFHDTEILNTLILYGTTSPWVEGHCKLLEETHSLASHGSTVGFFIY